MIALLIKLPLAYLLGSMSGALLIGRLRGVDIRQLGSGNAGGTNAFRTQGFRFALGTALIDIGKGALAAWLATRFFVVPDSALLHGLLAGAAAVLGHVWPIFHGFRGGKGAGTLVGVLSVLWPWSLLPLLATWLLSLSVSGYVGLSTMLAGLALIPSAWFLQSGGTRALWLVTACVCAAFLIFTHRSNLRKMRAGQEHRFDKARIWHRLLQAKR